MSRFHRPLNKNDLRGLLFLAALLVGIGAARYILDKQQSATSQPALSQQEVAELEAFDKATQAAKRTRASQQQTEADESYDLFAFDPNTAEPTTLLNLGLKTWQVRNMMRYRRKGGRWRSAEDFRRLYGLTAEQYERLRPYIVIQPSPQEISHTQHKHIVDSIHKLHSPKYPEGTVIDLNLADTNALKHIPGIGRYYAYKICRYRERLGGFVSTKQIREIEGLPADVERWFSVNKTSSPVQLNVNTATFKALIRHPYFSYEQVKAIFSHRQKYGKLHSLQDLRLLNVFTQEEEERLRPYLTF